MNKNEGKKGRRKIMGEKRKNFNTRTRKQD
jgi:hypothetical protein